MPQFDFDHGNNPVNTVPEYTKHTGKLTDQDWKHSVVHSRDYDISSLLTTISGFSYNVDYYSQLLGSGDEPRPFDPAQQEVFQQYHKIENYELKLQGSISQNFDTEANRMTTQGSALTYPHLIPNVGDAFIGDIGDGKAGLFTVFEALKKTRFKQTTYEIQFELSYVVDKSLFDTIEGRTVLTSYFDRDYIKFGMDPVLSSERYNAGKLLKSAIQELLAEYLSEFYSYEYSTLLVPSANKGVYDPFVVDIMLTLFDMGDHPLLAKISRLNTDESQFKKYISIWSILIRQQPALIDNCFSEVQVTPAKAFGRNPQLRTVAYSGIDLIVMPITRNLSVDDHLGLSKTLIGTRNTASATDSIRKPLDAEQEPLMSIPAVEGSPQYIFTQNFYEGIVPTPEQSEFENLIKRYLAKEHLDHRQILGFFNSRDYWTPFERFYLVPVLLILMIYKQRSI